MQNLQNRIHRAAPYSRGFVVFLGRIWNFLAFPCWKCEFPGEGKAFGNSEAELGGWDRIKSGIWRLDFHWDWLFLGFKERPIHGSVLQVGEEHGDPDLSRIIRIWDKNV